MPTVTNKQIAATLRKALPHIRAVRNGPGERYICYAIEETTSQRDGYRCVLSDVHRAAQAVIQSRIAPSSTMEEWLERRGIDCWPNFPKLQAYRRAWVKQLIKEFSTK